MIEGQLFHLKIVAVISAGSSTAGTTLHPATARTSPFPARTPGVAELAQACYKSPDVDQTNLTSGSIIYIF